MLLYWNSGGTKQVVAVAFCRRGKISLNRAYERRSGHMKLFQTAQRLSRAIIGYTPYCCKQDSAGQVATYLTPAV